MDAITQKIIQFFQNNQPRPITGHDISQAINEPFEDTVAALGNLLTQGYVYRAGSPASNFYWYPTKYTMEFGKKRTTKDWAPTTEYAAHQKVLKNLTPENRDTNFEKIQKEMDQYYPYFTQNHPEYKKLFQWLDRNVAHKKELLKDAAALFLRMDVKHNTIAYPGEKKYVIPSHLVSVENAMYESMTRFINNMPDKRKEVLTQDEYYDSYNKVSQLAEKVQQKFINEVVKVLPKGSVIPEDAISKFVEKDLNKLVPDKRHADMFLGMVLSKLATNGADPKVYKVFFTNTPVQTIYEVLAESLTAPGGVNIINRFKETSSDEKTTSGVYKKLFSSTDLSGYDLSGIDLGVSFTMESSRFVNTNFQGSKWADVKVQDCDFTGAKITQAIFNPSVFTNNIVKNLDLLNSVVNKKIKWDDNPGTPINLFIKDVDYDKAKLKEVPKTQSFRFTSVPLGEEELDDAKTVALFLKKFLEGKDTFANASLQLYKLAALNAKIVTQLRNWLSDENPQVPNFIPVDKLKDWMIENSRNGELAKAGFEPKDISILFKRSREISSPQVSQVSPEEQKKQDRDKKINQFLAQYQGQNSLPPDALISLLSHKEGNLYSWFSAFKKNISDIDLQKIYYTLVSSLKDYHVNPYVKPVRRYEAFPHSTYVHPLKDHEAGDFGFEHGHTLFAIVLNPDFSLMPPDIAKSTRQVTTYGTKHLQNAVAYTRIAPLSYILTSVKGRPQTKYVWFIVEMQSDAFQHALKGEWGLYKKMYDGEEPKRDKNELENEIDAKFKRDDAKSKYKNNLAAYEAASEFRSYFKHWPENLMNSIITLAGENNVDEIWMPRGEDVSNNVGQSTDWTYNYDRPAKVFGGKLKDVGVQVLLDPGFTNYRNKVSTVYVIEIPKGENLKLNWSVGVEDSAEEIAQRTTDAYSFEAFQMPYWIRLTQHMLDLGLNAEETEEFLRSKYTRYLRDSSAFMNYADDTTPYPPQKLEQTFRLLLHQVNTRKDEIIRSVRRDIKENFDEGAGYNSYTRKRLQDSGYFERNSSLKLNWDHTNTFLDTIYWKNFIKVFIANYVQKRIELGASDRGMLINEAVTAVLKEIPDEVTENYEFTALLQDIVNELKNEYGQSFEDLMISENSLKLDWADLISEEYNNLLIVYEKDDKNESGGFSGSDPEDYKYTLGFIISSNSDESYNVKRLEDGISFDAWDDVLDDEDLFYEEYVEDGFINTPTDIVSSMNIRKKGFILPPKILKKLKKQHKMASLKLNWNQDIPPTIGEEVMLIKTIKDAYGNTSRKKGEVAELLYIDSDNDYHVLFDKGLDTEEEWCIPGIKFKKAASSLKLNWNPGDPETSQEKKQRLLTIVKHPEYYSYTTSGGTWQMSEYEKALEELKDEFGINIAEPESLSKEDALSVHHPNHVEEVYKIPSRNNPGWAGGPWDESAQKAVLRSAGGMIKANQEALTNGIAVQMYDAFHHAYPDHGEGFCVLNDIAIAAKKISLQGKKVMIVDTDVHQGQGTAVCTSGDPNIFTLSTHGKELYPFRMEKSSLDVELKGGITDIEYLQLLENALNQALSKFQPDLVMYVAGTDLYGQDKLSNTNITLEGIQKRDQLVFKFFGEKGIPISTSIPQGYAHDPIDSRTMIKNTLREANKALSYYDKDNSLKLNWANVQETLKVGDKVKIIDPSFLYAGSNIFRGFECIVSEIRPRVLWGGPKENNTKGVIVLRDDNAVFGAPLTNWDKYLEKVS